MHEILPSRETLQKLLKTNNMWQLGILEKEKAGKSDFEEL